MSVFDPPRPGDDHWDEERNARFEDERRREREREHAPASPEELTQRFTRIRQTVAEVTEMMGEPVCQSPPIGPDPILLMVVQVPHGSEGKVVKAVARYASLRGVTLMLWDGRPRRRHRRGMRLLFGRRLGKRLTG